MHMVAARTLYNLARVNEDRGLSAMFQHNWTSSSFRGGLNRIEGLRSPTETNGPDERAGFQCLRHSVGGQIPLLDSKER